MKTRSMPGARRSCARNKTPQEKSGAFFILEQNMTKIILVRHGQTAWNREERFRGHADIPLDETGLAQAQAVAARVTLQWRPDVIYAGSLSRTLQTAEPTAQLFHLPVHPERDLVDVDCGDWQGFSPEEVRAK